MARSRAGGRAAGGIRLRVRGGRAPGHDGRQQWLVDQELATQDGATVRIRADLLAVLQRRELTGGAGQLSSELGLPFAEAPSESAIDEVYRRSVMVGGTKSAVIEKCREFKLVPWRPVLERVLGQQVTGIVRDGSISWTRGRTCGPEIGEWQARDGRLWRDNGTVAGWPQSRCWAP